MNINHFVIQLQHNVKRKVKGSEDFLQTPCSDIAADSLALVLQCQAVITTGLLHGVEVALL